MDNFKMFKFNNQLCKLPEYKYPNSKLNKLKMLLLTETFKVMQMLM